MHKKTKQKPSLKQAEMFGSFQTMTLVDCFKECGRLRRVMYGKMMAEEKRKALASIQPALDDRTEELDGIRTDTPGTEKD